MKENQIENTKINFESRNDGDLVIVSGDMEVLKKLGVAFIESLENSFYFRNDDEKNNFYNGDELRPGGVFAVKFRNGQLWLENRNGRGNSTYTTQLQKIIEEVRKNLNI